MYICSTVNFVPYSTFLVTKMRGDNLNQARLRPNNLRGLRKERDISIVQLARNADVTEGFVAMVERGIRTPSLYVAKKFAETLGLPLDIIFSSPQSTVKYT